MSSKTKTAGETNSGVTIVRAPNCPNATIRNAYTAGHSNSIPNEVLLHLADCITCNKAMYPNHTSKGQSETYIKGHKVWCIICRNIK